MSISDIVLMAAAQLPQPPANDVPAIDPAQMVAGQVVRKSQAGSLSSILELNLTLIILFFGVLALVLLYMMVRNERSGAFELRIYVITILVFGSLLVVSSGYATDQIAPVIGFFGTIAGYILGRGDRPNAQG